MSKQRGDINPVYLGLRFAGVNHVHFYPQANGKSPAPAARTVLLCG